ncbi:murein biosynthesis integral membrane protein MurJ [Streptomyces halstedii]|uniref:murein biosynthesis integral membrane protein MurJ n=1 Tax=Streptomyces halstedii TaxID=1944 RepID=UPI0037F29637
MSETYDGEHGRNMESGDPARAPGARQEWFPHVDHQDSYEQDSYYAEGDGSQAPASRGAYFYEAQLPYPSATDGSWPSASQPLTSQHGFGSPGAEQMPPPEAGSAQPLPYQGDVPTTQFRRIEPLATPTGEPHGEPDAFAFLYRDQQHQVREHSTPHPSTEAPTTQVTPESIGGAHSKKVNRAATLLKSSALMAAGTMVSRITGFLRTLVMAAAIGVGALNDTYQVANVLPTMIYILVAGGALNAVFIPQLVRAMENDADRGEAYANRLLSLVMVLLGGVTLVGVVGAPYFVRMMSPEMASHPQQFDVAIAFARYCIPTMFFMGVHVVLGQILNARGHFGAMMWTPVLNNVVIIAAFGAFIWVFGSSSASGVSANTITPEGVRLLGVGTLLGLVVQALAMLPYLREAGFRFRLRFDWRGHGLGKTASLAKWTLLFVLANQIGMVVVTQLATAAGATADEQGHPGTGITAYNYALLLWQMPQAIITVSVMTAVLPRISRSASDGDFSAVRDDLSYGMRTSAVAIVPCAFAFLALGVPVATLLYSGTNGSQNIGYVLMAFGLGLIPYSVQYVVLRGFYAYEDTRTPFYNTIVVAVVNALASFACYVILPARWAVVGMAASYGLAYAVGFGVAWRRLRKRLRGDLDGSRVARTYARLVGASIPAALVGGGVAFGVMRSLGSGGLGSLVALSVGGVALIAVFFFAARRMRIEELNGMVGMIRGRLGR